MRTLFFGTPQFAVPTLAAMVEAGYQPSWVISQPSRPVGRSRQVTDPPVAAWARQHGLPLLQPEKVTSEDFMARLRDPRPDVAVVVAFGQIFRQPLLDLPRLGCVNVHASLLPKYRGAAPIQAAIAAGDRVTGVTTMQMERGLDSGPMLQCSEIAIGDDETYSELTPRLAELGAQTLVRTLDALAADGLPAQAQDDASATFAPRLSKEDSVVDWAWSARQIYNRWRAFEAWPGLTTHLGERRVKILAGHPVIEVSPMSESQGTASQGSANPGQEGGILGLRDGKLEVRCGGGTILALSRLQAAGKKAVSAADFANGERLHGGECFSQPSQPVDAGVP